VAIVTGVDNSGNVTEATFLNANILPYGKTTSDIPARVGETYDVDPATITPASWLNPGLSPGIGTIL
jgi:hypothetical protein